MRRGPDQISAEAAVALQLEVERRRGVLVGWYHSHPTGDARLSPEDVKTHERLFSEAWQVAFLFVTDPRAPAGACFRRTPEGLDGELRLPFYEMVTNESLLAKGVRRSRVDWENVSTLENIRLEPPPRPAPPPAAPPSDVELAPEPPAEAPAETREEIPEEIPEPDVDESPEEVAEEIPEPDVDEIPKGVAGEEFPDVDVVDLARGEGDAGLIRDLESAPTEHDPDALDLDEADFGAFQLDEGDASDDEPEGNEETDDLDLDALIAEVEGLGSAEVEISDLPEVDGASEESEPEPVSVSEPEIPTDEVPEAELPESVPPAATVSSAEPETEAEFGSLVEIESELTSVSPVESDVGPDESTRGRKSVAPSVPPTVPTDGIVESAPATEPGRKLRNRILVALGIVICLGVVGVLVQVLVFGRDGDVGAIVEEQPAAVEIPVTETPAASGEVDVDDVAPGDLGEDSIAVVVEPPAAAPAPAPAVSVAELKELSDEVLASISTYYGRDGAFSAGEIGCPELQSSFVEVMDSWIDYSTRGRAGWQGRLPPDLVDRDERLYLGVQDVERLFEASSCPRP